MNTPTKDKYIHYKTVFLSFVTHLKRATKVLEGMPQLMPKTYDSRERGRVLYASVVQSVILYVAPIWLNAMGKTIHRQILLRVQRKAALLIARVCRTASSKTLLVLARTLPIDLVAKGQTSILQGK